MKKIENFLIGKKELPEIRPGDSVKVYYRIKEGEKERTQIFFWCCFGEKKRKKKLERQLL
jgi:ribosomal protein L19